MLLTFSLGGIWGRSRFEGFCCLATLVSRVKNSLPYLRCVLTWVAGLANKRGDDERKTEGATGLE